jgi:hypothetical protein
VNALQNAICLKLIEEHKRLLEAKRHKFKNNANFTIKDIHLNA